jgi:hypothetical protein
VAVHLEAARDLAGRGVPVHIADWDGEVRGVRRT